MFIVRIVIKSLHYSGASGLSEKSPASFENLISVVRRSYRYDWQHIYNLSTGFQYTVTSYTPRIPSVKADNVLSVTRVTLAN